MKVSFLVPARDKEKHVGKCVESVLAQTYTDMEIILSDQGSVDGTREVMARLVSGHKGPHRVRLVDCPDTEPKGYAGMNAHLRWLIPQCEGDVIMMTSADDICHPQRAERTVQTFQHTNASFVGTTQAFCRPDDMMVTGITAWPPESGWVDARTHLFKLTGSSASTAWARDLLEKYEPFELVSGNDVTCPFYACLERGFFFLAEELHAYIRHSDPNNTGLEGALRAAEGDNAKTAQLLELCSFQLCHTYLSMIRKVQQLWPDREGDEIRALHEVYCDTAVKWTNVREQMTANRVPPIPMRS